MEQLANVLDRALPDMNTPKARNTRMKNSEVLSSMKSRIEEAKQRMEAEKARFLCPRRDEQGNWVETECLTCNDHGLVVWSPNPADPNVDYQSFPCPDCGGKRFDKTANLLKHSGIPDASRAQRFENFIHRKGTEVALKAAKILTSDPEMGTSEVIMILIFGSTGSGKTHLAHASGMEAILKGIPVKFVRCGALLREFKGIKSSEDEGQAKYDRLFVAYSQCPYLIVDDLDWGTAADIRMLEDLFCEREANHLLTLVTTNRNSADLEDALPRTIDRFRSKRFGRIVSNQAPSFRSRKGGD